MLFQINRHCKAFVEIASPFLHRCGFGSVTISSVAQTNTDEQGDPLKRILWTIVVALLPAAAQASGELLMIAPLNQTMPLAQFENDKITGGILKDLGEAIARRMGRSPAFISVAGDQVSTTLAQGKADAICYVRPFWIDGDYNWSRPLIPDAELVASLPDAPVVRSLMDLRDRPVGTVGGYRYPRVEQVLGLRFLRQDSTTMEENLRKMMQGTFSHTVVGQATLAYQLKVNKGLKLRSDLVFASFTAQCAFSKRSNAVFGEADKAINSLIDDGSVDAILARYR
jgi:polar amino acid transport system substrate-binding protein